MFSSAVITVFFFRKSEEPFYFYLTWVKKKKKHKNRKENVLSACLSTVKKHNRTQCDESEISLGFLIYFLSTCISHFYKVLFNALCKAISVIKYSSVRMHISFLQQLISIFYSFVWTCKFKCFFQSFCCSYFLTKPRTEKLNIDVHIHI